MRFILLVAISLISFNIYGQTQEYQFNKMVPASPTAAALGRYGDIPVNLFNGTPIISIPLYSIKTPNNNVEIEMSYNATGTRVNDEATWVGLGWSLMAGGLITRTVRQKDDLNNGYNNSPELPATFDWDSRFPYFDNVFAGLTDVEPDIFIYNFCGKTGRFVMGKSIDGNPVYMDQKNNLKIEYQNIYPVWVITDEQGCKFFFSTIETALNYSVSTDARISDFKGLTYKVGISYVPLSPENVTMTTSWYLDSIIPVTGEIIKFSYEKGLSLSPVYKTESRYITLGAQTTECTNFALVPTEKYDIASFNYSRQEIQNVYLKKIEFLNGTLEFKLADRKDIEAVGNLNGGRGPSRLEEIVIKNKKGQKIKSFLFHHSYFNSADTKGRLKLDSIVEMGSGGGNLAPYRFTYYNPDDLPDKDSYSIDHWGFENGTENRSLIAYSITPNAHGQLIAFDPYCDREAEETNNYPMNGVLAEISYPTGGNTKFEYELHEFGNLMGDMAYKTVHQRARAYNNPTNPYNDLFKQVEVTIPPISGLSEVPVEIQFEYRNIDTVYGSLPDSGIGGSIIAQMQLLNETGDVVGTAYSYSTDQIHELVGVHHGDKSIPSGKYRITVSTSSSWNYDLKVSWSERIAVEQRRGGGIRIKKIENNDAYGNKNEKTFTYNDINNHTSGILLNTPKYDIRNWIYAKTDPGLLDPMCEFKMDLYQLSAQNIFPPGVVSSPGIVGYKKVTEFDNINGKTEYFYHCSPDSAQYIFPGVPQVAKPLTGKLDSTLVYNNDGELLKKIKYSYEVKSMNALPAFKLFGLPTLFKEIKIYSGIFYDDPSFWSVLVEQDEIVYQGNNQIESRSKFFYENEEHRLVTEQVSIDSKGDTVINLYKRPGDFIAPGGTSFVEQMKTLHIISPVIEQQTLLKSGIDRKLKSGSFILYQKFHDRFYKPNITYTLEIPNPISDFSETSFLQDGQPSLDTRFRQQVHYTAFDPIGNTLSLVDVKEGSLSYVWGYDGQYPIAMVVKE